MARQSRPNHFQVRSLSQDRFVPKLGQLNHSPIEAVTQALAIFFALIFLVDFAWSPMENREV
ncbi:MAG: hypothetical protein H6659_19810 [Ardenticatenaceae bacterium]|nr:hypothetical protein [Ardenticatenaceae bacterium]